VLGKHHQMGDVSVLNSLVSGSVAGVVAIIVCHPLDTIRVRLQTSNKFAGAMDCAIQTVRNEGGLALYKGMAIPLLAQAVYKAIMFGGYNGSQKVMKKLLEWRGKEPVLSIGHLFICGGIAGGMNSFVVTPVELIRNRLMVDYAAHKQDRLFRGPVHCAVSVVKQHGISAGLYRGLAPTLMRDVPGVGTWYAFFEITRRFLTTNNYVTGFPATLCSGAAAGIGFWSVALPMDRIKSVMQTDIAHRYRNFLQCLSSVTREEGVASLYKGWQVAFMRGIPGSAVTFSVYSYVSKYLSSSL